MAKVVQFPDMARQWYSFHVYFTWIPSVAKQLSWNSNLLACKPFARKGAIQKPSTTVFYHPTLGNLFCLTHTVLSLLSSASSVSPPTAHGSPSEHSFALAGPHLSAWCVIFSFLSVCPIQLHCLSTDSWPALCQSLTFLIFSGHLLWNIWLKQLLM